MAGGSFIDQHQKIPALILAGGLGTRLRGVIPDRPKPMAFINGKPFLEYLISFIHRSGAVSRIILSVGYKHEQITEFFGSSFKSLPITYSIENTPLGTGGAVKKAAEEIPEDIFLLFNGDTLFTIDIGRLIVEHFSRCADITIALKRMHDFDRYGIVVYRDGIIGGFEEKRAVKEGLINGGIYVVSKNFLSSLRLPQVFSLEKDLLQTHIDKIAVAGVVFDDYFIDIGVPEDLVRAQSELSREFTDSSIVRGK